jgi:TonB family protein
MRGLKVVSKPFVVALVLVLMDISSSPAQEQPDLDALASQAATAIHKSVESGGKKVLVVDFGIAHAKPNKLSVVLADRFADSLRKNSQGLVVLDRKDYIRATEEDFFTPEARADEQVARCYSGQLDADFVLQGMIEAGPDSLQLDVQVERLGDWRTVFTGKVSLPVTADLPTYLSQPMAPSPSPRGDKNTWRDPANPTASTDPDAIPYSGANGTTNLACIYCPTAQFSDAAVKGKVQGTVILGAVIDATGHPASISVIRPLPCGLNTQAIEALKGWRLKPATDSDGKPVAVRTTIEMIFHLF